MEKKIAASFLGVFGIGLMIRYIYDGINDQLLTINIQIFQSGVVLALTYLYWIWVFSRRHRLLTLLGTVNVVLLFSSMLIENGKLVEILNGTEWAYEYIMILVHVVLCIVAYKQGNKLFEEVQKENKIATIYVKYKHDSKEK